MFIQVKKSGYTREGAQYVQGYFLMLLRPVKGPYTLNNVRGLVRYVRMRQFGHFMMGEVRVGAQRLVLSGFYGCEGLTMSVPPEVYALGTPLPDVLYDLWDHGGSWGPGRDADEMRKWGHAVRYYQNNRKRHIKFPGVHCYRCGRVFNVCQGPMNNTSEITYPCVMCQNEIRLMLNEEDDHESM